MEPQPPGALTGPGFVTVLLDIPVGIAIPNGAYRAYDAIKGVAVVQFALREGSRSFFRNAPTSGPTSFADLKEKARQYERPRPEHSYIGTSVLADGTEKATLNIHCGENGGFAEASYYSEAQVTFLVDDIGIMNTDGGQLARRSFEILNGFLDKYRLLAEDYRVSHISEDRNFYVALLATSPLSGAEIGFTAERLVDELATGRRYYHALGQGGSTFLRLNSLDNLGPWQQLANESLAALANFAREKYDAPLSYDLIMQALRSLQIDRDTKLAIVHAATAVEVHIAHLLHKVLVALGRSDDEAQRALEGPDYDGVHRRLQKLEEHTKAYGDHNGVRYVRFVGNASYNRWKSIVAHKRNRAVHAGVSSFTWAEGAEVIGIAKETIVFLDQRIPSLANRVRLSTAKNSLRESSGRVLL